MIRTTPEQMDEMIDAIKSEDYESNEKVWTLLIASILSNSPSKKYYLKLFCDDTISITSDYDIWFEAQPLSPRKDKKGHTETNTKLDLAFGNIKERDKTGSGIEYTPVNDDSWVCFVEAKFNSDILLRTTHDPNRNQIRNQIIRVIENLLCFQGKLQFPKKLFFVLLIPRRHQDDPDKEYNNKIEEYKNYGNISRDLKSAVIQERRQDDWKYPDDIENRIKLLKIKKIYYEDIFEKEFNMSDLDLTNLDDTSKNFFKKILNDLAINLNKNINR